MLSKLEPIDAEQVREIRRRLGLTQSDFAAEIGVSKVTVARWESGARSCGAGYAGRVRQLDRNQSGRTTSIFAVESDDLSRLEPTEAVEVFRDLLWCDARLTGLSPKDVRISLVEIPDGGIDAEVSGVKSSDGGALVGGANFFQIKAGATDTPWTPSWVNNELFGKKKAQHGNRDAIGAGVKRCFDLGGRYVLACFGLDLTPQQLRISEELFTTRLTECGFKKPRVEVWGQQQLIGLLARFPSLALKLTGRQNLEFWSFASWAQTEDMSTAFFPDDAQQTFVASLRELLRGNDIRHVRVIGEPGLGKTRLVLEALRHDDLKAHVVYVPRAEEFARSQLFNNLLRPDANYFTILVLDECPKRESASIWNALRRRSDQCRIVSIDHDPDESVDSQLRVIECPSLGDEKIAEILKVYIPGDIDTHRWVQFCSGSPRVAHAVGYNLKVNPDDILRSPATVQLWDRFVAGYRRLDTTASQQKLTVLRHLALFHRFGFEDPVTNEAHIIAKLVEETDSQITWGKFQSIVAELKRQRILQGSTTLFIAPRLLHVHLWTDFWNNYGRRFPLKDFILDLSSQPLLRWFIRMLRFAGESGVATTQVEELLGQSGPFSDPAFASTEIACELLDELAEAAPSATLACIERIVGAHTVQSLSDFTRGRQHIVWALEKIAIYPSCFSKAALLLRTLAERENATHSNNSTGTFAGLFSLSPGRLAPTGAPPEDRLPVLVAALESTRPETRRLGLQACRAALTFESTNRIIGAEYHGLRPLPDLWTPKTWGEVHAAMGVVWKQLHDVSRTWDDGMRTEANDSLIDVAFTLLQIDSLAKNVLDTLNSLIGDRATDLKKVVEIISRIRRFWPKSVSPETLNALRQVDERIHGSSFRDSVRRVVLLSGYDDYLTNDGKSDPAFHKQVEMLAQNAFGDTDKFHSVLGDLICGNNNTVFHFGQLLARSDKKRVLLPDITAGYRLHGEKASSLLLGGYLAEMSDSTPEEWEVVICNLIGDNFFIGRCSGLVRPTAFTDRVILELVRAIDDGRIGGQSFVSFEYCPRMRVLQDDTLAKVLERLLAADQIACALNICDFVYCDQDSPRNLPEELTLKILRASELFGGTGNMVGYHWKVVAERFLGQYPLRQMVVFESIIDKVVHPNSHITYDAYPLEVVTKIIAASPSECWSAFVSRLKRGERMERWRLLRWAGPHATFGRKQTAGLLSTFPLKDVFDWVAEDPEDRAQDIAQIAPKSFETNEGGEFTRELLNRYGDDVEVRRALVRNFWSEGWLGQASEHYRGKVEIARKWLAEERSARVRQWLEEYIDHLSHDIRRAEIEEEREN